MRLFAAAAALLLFALPAAAAIATYQIRGNTVGGANNITAITAVETAVYTGYPGGNAATIAQCPDGFIYYTINGGAGASAVYKFNPQTPEVAPVQLTANSGSGDAFRLACSAAGTLYIVPDNGQVWTINTTTGAGTNTGATITGAAAGGDMAFDSSGQLWLVSSGRQLYKVSVAGGAATPWCVATFAGGNTPATLGISFPTTATNSARLLAQQGGGLATSGVYTLTLPAAAVAPGGTGNCGAAPALVTNVGGSTTTGDLAATDVVAPSVTVSKSDGVTTYVPGGTTTYTVTLTNNSAYPVTYIVTDNQPANVTFGTWTCNAVAGSFCGLSGTAAFTTTTTTGAGNSISGTRVRLAASGGSATYTIPATYAAGATGAITNTASVAVSSWLPAPTGTPSASDTNVVRPAVAKTFGAAAIADGGTTTLVFTLTNSAGNPVQSAISLGDTLPTGLALNSATPAVAYSAGCSGPATAVYTAGTRVLSGLTGIAMSVGTASCTVSVAGLTNQPGQVNASCAGSPAAFTNLPASVTATNASNASANQCLVVNTSAPTLTKAFAPAAIAAGATSTLTITLSNPNSVAAALSAALTDTLPTGVTVAATPGAASTCTGAGALTATAGSTTVTLATPRSIPAGSSVTPGTCTITVNVTASLGGAYVNTLAAGALQTSNGNNAAAGSATLTVNTVAPTVAKAFAPATISAGGTSTLTITLSNSNTSAAALSAALTDTLPAGVTVAATPNAASTCTGAGALTAAAGSTTVTLATPRSIPAGSSVTPGTCTITVDVTASLGGAYVNTLAAGALQTSNGNNAAAGSATLTVNAVAPTVAKAFAPATISAGGTSTLTITLSNSNTSAAALSATLTDTLPAGVTVAATPGAASTCTGAGALTATAGSTTVTLATPRSIPAGSGVMPGTCTITVNVTASLGGAYVNTLAAGALQTSNGNNAAAGSATLTVNTVAPTIAKAFTPAAIPVNGRSLLTFTLSNSNPTALTGMDFTDTYPVGVVNAAPLTVGGTCAGVTHTATAGGGSFNVTSGTIPPGSCTITVQVTSAAVGAYNNTTSGVLTAQTAVRGAVSNTAPLTVAANSLSMTKTVTTLCDPVKFAGNGGTVFPHAIPGAYMRYQITISNAAGGLSPVALTTIGDVLDPNLTFDTDLRTGNATQCAASPPENALLSGFKLSCTGGTRACTGAPVFFTSAADADAMGISGSSITLAFGDGPAGTKALPTEAGYGPGELKPGESVTIRFNVIVK